LVQRVLRLARGPIVVDADGLNALAPLSAARLRSLPGSRVVLTPHPGEAGRLLGTTSSAVQKDRDAALAELCARSGATVVLKGAGTLVGDGTRCFRNRTGNPGMATGGTGDVLAGLLAALLAQGLAPFEAACLAAHVHGKAGDRVARRLGEVGLIAADLPMAIAEELA
jgi:NAD(P)H-hydrate epimerase